MPTLEERRADAADYLKYAGPLSDDVHTEHTYFTSPTADLHAVITMGCGDACPFYPGKRYEDWVLEDPAGQGIESVRGIRDEIKKRVETLLAELLA